ncbi:MAG: hybrid sensor histidine kinase/response regulator [Marinospirillum sp.]|uniref:ATP-binding response regulator n=1 Tax=Marinospirillum sp. TaxID=2183934 RepID=UPI0019F6DE60|nr:hybrid sensor histidine kinase/response regulator [Marinospirillum sp.]MBE0506225.1 hybrid sensor histidine kinase/response regulator [Marinospirillum sp.]
MSPVPLHPLTLRFTDPVVEQTYLAYDFPRLVDQSRVSSVVAIVCYLALGLLFDHLLFSPEDQAQIWQIRLTALLVPFGVLLLTFHPLFRKCNHLPIAMIGLAGGIGMILMSLYLPTDKLEYYYPGLMAIVFFTYNLAGTRFIYALGVDLTLFTLYNLAMLGRGDVPTVTLAISDLYIGMANLIGGTAGYLTERQQRRLFLGEQETHHAYATRTRFLAAVSHDLRQPIHAQGLFLNLLQQTPLNPRQQEIVSHISAASTATGDMLHTLMDFSRIEAGAVQPCPRAFLLQPLLNKIEREFMPQADAKGLNYRSRETRLAVYSDPSLVEVMLRNLVSNAIRYTPQGSVLVACRKQGDQAVLAVYDTGIGIEPAAQNLVFEEFQQLNNPERERTKGLGLGLAIVKGLANTLQHRLKLVSIPGRGSRFELLLPLTHTKNIPIDESPTLAMLGRSRIRYKEKGLRVLLVENDEAAREATSLQLQDWGFECDAVDGLEAALVVVETRPPVFIISDFCLGGSLNGAEVVTKLCAVIGKPLPALLITAETAPLHLQEAEHHGLTLLHKPVVPSELYRKIVTLLETTPTQC